MNVNLITVPKADAEKEYKIYAEALKSGRKETYLEDLKKLNFYLAKGKKVINVYDAFRSTGLNESGFGPKLAIAKADTHIVYFQKKARGSGKFSHNENPWWTTRGQYWFEVDLPDHTYSDWVTEVLPGRSPTIKNEVISARVPIVPARLLPKGGLQNYHIIWEIEKWDPVLAPKDPILVKRVTKNMFVVLASWDLTPLERALIEGNG